MSLSLGVPVPLEPLGASLRPERLPTALTARLENIAQYAPAGLASVYHSDYSSGTGTYGMFDGLDHLSLYVPVVSGSPRQSPHKYSTSVTSPHDGVYAVSAGQFGEEDEF